MRIPIVPPSNDNASGMASGLERFRRHLRASATGTVTAVVLAAGSGGDVRAEAAPPCASAAACYELGRAASGDARRQRFSDGMALARARLAQKPDDVEGLFWLAVNTGAEALERGRMRALPALPEMEKLLIRAHAASPGYAHGGPARVLGRLYHKAPSVISIGSGKRARQWLETALALDPGYPGNLAFAADFLADEREGARSLDLARRCLAALDANPSGYGAEAAEWRALARAIVAGAS